MAELLLRVEGVVKRFGGFQALGGVSPRCGRGRALLGLIGPNGSGKTTLISCISGTLRNEAGRIFAERTSRGCPRINGPGWASRGRSRSRGRSGA